MTTERTQIAAKIQAIGEAIIPLEAAQLTERTEERRRHIVDLKAERAALFRALEKLPRETP